MHPSLYPLMYGKSKYLPSRTVPLHGCSAYTGQGDAVPTPTLSANDIDYSAKHQWLPCEVLIGTNGEARIKSYINNLHPDGNEALYTAIEQVISQAIPLWKATVRSTLYHYEQTRVIVEGDGYDHEGAELVEEERRQYWQERWEAQKEDRASDNGTENAREAAQGADSGDGANDGNGEDNDDDDDEYIEECYKSKYIKVPEPGPYEPRTRIAMDEDATSFQQMFSGNNLQVIVKLANIHLTPDKPTYDGGSWHIEVGTAHKFCHYARANSILQGLPNEHICASAPYYYDSSNVTESFLAFRESVDESLLSENGYLHYPFPLGPSYAQGEPGALIEIYGLNDQTNPYVRANLHCSHLSVSSYITNTARTAAGSPSTG